MPQLPMGSQRLACAWVDVVRLIACPYRAAEGSPYCAAHAASEKAAA